jgi:hypothetical protein
MLETVFNDALQPIKLSTTIVQCLISINPLVCATYYYLNQTDDTPLAPLDEIAPHILRLWKTRQTDRNIVRILREKHIDTERYGIGYVDLCYKAVVVTI